MVITLAQVKQYTTLTDANDADITAMLPIIDAKVKEITGNRWNWLVYAEMTSGSVYAEVYSILDYNGRLYQRNDFMYSSGVNAPWVVDDIADFLKTGAQLSGQGVASGSYIEEVYYHGGAVTLDGTNYTTPVIKMSAAATATSATAQIFLNIPLSYVPTIAKGVQWLIAQSSNASPASAQGGVASKRMGPVSVTYSGQDAAIDGRYGMPGWFVKALGSYHRGY